MTALSKTQIEKLDIIYTNDDFNSIQYVDKTIISFDFIYNILVYFETRNKPKTYILSQIYEMIEIELVYKLLHVLLAEHLNEFRFVPSSLITPEFAMKYLKIDGKIIMYLDSDMITREMCIEAIKSNVESIKFMDKMFITDELYKIGLSCNGMLLSMIPQSLQNKEYAELAINNCPSVIEYLRRDLQTEELVIKALKDENTDYWYIRQDVIGNSRNACKYLMINEYHCYLNNVVDRIEYVYAVVPMTYLNDINFLLECFTECERKDVLFDSLREKELKMLKNTLFYAFMGVNYSKDSPFNGIYLDLACNIYKFI